MPWQTLPKLDDLQRWLPSACGGVQDELLLHPRWLLQNKIWLESPLKIWLESSYFFRGLTPLATTEGDLLLSNEKVLVGKLEGLSLNAD